MGHVIIIWGTAIFLICLFVLYINGSDNSSNSNVSKSNSSLDKQIINYNSSSITSLNKENARLIGELSHSHLDRLGQMRDQQRLNAIEFFEEGKKDKSEGYLKRALNKFSSAIDLNEKLKEPNANYYYYRALVNVELFEYHKAIYDYSKAISIDPLHIYYNNRGVLRNETKDYNGAIDDFTKALLIKPNNHLSLVNRGKCHFDFGYKSLAKSDWINAAERGDRQAKKYLDQHFKDDIEKLAPIAKRASKISPADHSSIIKPNSEDVFRIEQLNGLYAWYAIFDYYPKNRFSESELSDLDIQVRQHVYSFKDGRNPKYFAEMFASALINKFGSAFFIGKVMLIVPASNKEKTMVRFQSFCKLLSSYLGAIDGFELLNNNDKVKMPSHGGGNRREDLEQYLTINENIKLKELIIIDDVRTSGSSSNQIFSILKNKGVSSMTFAYLARTVPLNSLKNPFELDDLPF